MSDELLTSDHRELDVLFEQVFGCLDAADRDGTYKSLDLFWARLAMHIRAEHLHLFPALAKAGDPWLRAVLDRLRAEHDLFMKELASAIKQLRAPTPEWDRHGLRERLATIRSVLAEHNKVEEEDVYPEARLGDGGHISGGLREAILKELKNLPPRFKPG